jgi:hypothetical protein
MLSDLESLVEGSMARVVSPHQLVPLYNIDKIRGPWLESFR